MQLWPVLVATRPGDSIFEQHFEPSS